jgi:hypothetical protein
MGIAKTTRALDTKFQGTSGMNKIMDKLALFTNVKAFWDI